MHGFLRGHMRDLFRSGVVLQHRELPGINARGTVFAGMVDAQCGSAFAAQREIAGEGTLRRGR